MTAVTLLRHGVAVVTVSTLALLASAVGPGTPTASAADQWQCGFYTCYHQWRITRVTHARARHGKWHTCVSFDKSPHSAQANCSLAKSRSTTVTATITGNLMVPKATLSAAVGYQVQQTSTATASYTAIVPAHRSGVIQWAPVFTQRRRVQQRQWTCRYSKYGFHTCNKDGNNVYRYVYTEKYSHPRFRVRYHH